MNAGQRLRRRMARTYANAGLSSVGETGFEPATARPPAGVIGCRWGARRRFYRRFVPMSASELSSVCSMECSMDRRGCAHEGTTSPRSSAVSPVITRAPRPCVTKLTDQRMSTRTRFWKPTRYQRSTTSHVSHARKPLRWMPLTDGDGGGPADRREVAFVAVAERWTRLAAEPRADDARRSDPAAWRPVPRPEAQPAHRRRRALGPCRRSRRLGAPPVRDPAAARDRGSRRATGLGPREQTQGPHGCEERTR
jgi:hypothetical protein